MGVFIDGMGNISPQPTWNDEAAILQAYDYRGSRMFAVEPSYDSWFTEDQITSIPRLAKMCIAASRMALAEAEIKLPDGIITGTGFGCETRIEEVLHHGFSSTYTLTQTQAETLGYFIARHLECNAFNQTFSQDGLSFESALLDAILRLRADPDKKILVGGADEFTETVHLVLTRMGVLRKKIASTLNLFKPLKPGTIQGEGACYFVITGNRSDFSQAEVADIRMLHKPSPQRLQDAVEVFIRDNGLVPNDIDLTLAGRNGDKRYDAVLDELVKRVFPAAMLGLFKHLSGEFPTASAFALWLAVRILKERHVPEVITFNHINKPVRHVLIINSDLNASYSMILLRSCMRVL